jgi:16S rRNA (cytosine967-C5)-methyltransferase
MGWVRPPLQAESNAASPTDAPGVPARRAALRLLDGVLRRGQPLGTPSAELSRGDDRALAQAIAAEVLRRLPDLDALIDGATRNRLPDDAKARFALRIALAQALRLGTPPHAAIATVLPLVDGGPRKLVHGVFGALMRGGASLPEPPTLPAAVAERWGIAWGDAMVEGTARAIAEPPPLDVSLQAEVPELGGVSLAPHHLRLARAGNVTALPGYAEGAWWVQDLAATIPARLIGPGNLEGGPGTVLDLCAAPGGKTLQLAAAGWRVIATDKQESRLARLRDNLARARLTADLVATDLLDWTPPAPADAVLLDAPCSASGIVRRHPDVMHRVRPPIIAEAAALQTRLLARAADWVRPGGLLVYATCSLEPEEGEDQLARFMADRMDFELEPPRDGELPAGIAADPRGWVRTFPGMLADQGGVDGFFVARWRRRA